MTWFGEMKRNMKGNTEMDIKLLAIDEEECGKNMCL